MANFSPLPDDLYNAQQWVFTLGGARGEDMALAYAVLLGPRREKDEHQHLLVLKGSSLKQQTTACQRNIHECREKLISLGPIGDENGYTLSGHVIFSSPSLAASVIYGGSCNGWESWRLSSGLVSRPGITLAEAYRLSKLSKFTPKYYEVPDGVYSAG